MTNFYRIIAVIAIIISFAGCNPSDDDPTVKLRDYNTQYVTDLALIQEFLKTHSYTVNNNPGAHTDQDVTFTDVPENDPTAIWNSEQLLEWPVTRNGVSYTIYYLKLRDGGGADASNLRMQPSNVDAVLAAYEGRYITRAIAANEEEGIEVGDLVHRVFENTPFPTNFLPLESVIQGWREIFPQFRPGDRTSVVGEPNLYTDFGAGVMFIPSGLAYYNNLQGSIPAYAPLIFSFKLYDVNRLDQDSDGIPSYLEDLNGDRYIRYNEEGVANTEDDTDDDGIADYLDFDDDNDGALTRTELRRPVDPAHPNAAFTYYSFNGAAVDDPTTPFINETYGIPRCFTTPPTYDPDSGTINYNPLDFTAADRLRRHLDPTCKPPYGDEFE
ncbi:MAG TPA: FKBP-type peptidylprolyl isomerase [Flavobacterium sp.]|jgi:hypothetical protein